MIRRIKRLHIAPAVRELASLSEQDLLAIRDEIKRFAEVELNQVEDALELRRYWDSIGPARRATRHGETRTRILNAIQVHGAASPAQVIDAIGRDGDAPSDRAVYTMLGRLVKEGTLTRVSKGRYTLTQPNGDAPDSTVPADGSEDRDRTPLV